MKPDSASTGNKHSILAPCFHSMLVSLCISTAAVLQCSSPAFLNE